MTEAAELTTTVTGPAPRRAIDIFDEGARRHPDRICFRFGDESLTYREVESLSHRVAAALAADGLGRGSHAAVLSANQPNAFVCVLGILRAGGVWLSINARNSTDENIRTPTSTATFCSITRSSPTWSPNYRLGRRACVAASASTNGTAQTPHCQPGPRRSKDGPCARHRTGRPGDAQRDRRHDRPAARGDADAAELHRVLRGRTGNFQEDRPLVFLAAAR